jgi:hypothetical protein
MAKSIAKACLQMTGLFEAELLTELLLRHWNHPLAADPDYRSALLESAAGVLRASVKGERLFEDLDPKHVNLVAALWYSEQVSLEQVGDIPPRERKRRQAWLNDIARAIPSCFCNPDRLT